MNPRPDCPIESLEIVPRGPRFLIAAITLGRLDEDPFAREGRRAARIILTDDADAQRPFDLGRRGGPRRYHLCPSLAGGVNGRIPERFLQGLGTGPEPWVQSRLCRDLRHTLGDRDGPAGRRRYRQCQLGRGRTVGVGDDPANAVRADRPRKELGQHYGARRGDWRARAVPRALSVSGGSPLSAARPP